MSSGQSKFITTATEIPGCFVVEGTGFTDDRGTFEEVYNREDFSLLGLPSDWAQDNLSFSQAKVIRGIHLQQDRPQGKLMRCVFGTILDVCVDLRLESPTFGRYVTQILTAHDHRAFYLPPGTGHGFCVLSSDGAWVHYKCTSLYDKETDGGVNYADPSLAIRWPVSDPIISFKDTQLPTLQSLIARGADRIES